MLVIDLLYAGLIISTGFGSTAERGGRLRPQPRQVASIAPRAHAPRRARAAHFEHVHGAVGHVARRVAPRRQQVQVADGAAVGRHHHPLPRMPLD